MIAASHIAELMTFETPVSSVVSLFLEVADHSLPSRSFRRLVAEASERKLALGAEHEEDLARIESFLAEPLPSDCRGLAVFSSRRFGLWRPCKLSLPVRDRLSVGTRPRMGPVLSVASHFQRYGVVLADAAKARFVEYFMGRAAECGGMTARESSSAGSGLQAFVKACGRAVERVSVGRLWDRVVLAAPPPLLGLLAGRLRAGPTQILDADPGLLSDADVSVVRERLREREGWDRRSREAGQIERLLQTAVAGGPAVIGLSAVLSALERGMVRILFVRDGFARMGRLCGSCGALSLTSGRCLACGHPTAVVFNVVEEMIQRAIDRGCGVVRLLHQGPLDPPVRVAAELAAPS
ncbi:MAG: hypothetical protein HY924_09735 [Elusimicrobia bacterium]|nr:hypothetical protein [Elusimicrobiota bacterium]